MVLRYFMNKQYCEIAYGLSPGKLMGNRLAFVAKLLGILLGIVFLFSGAMVQSSNLQMIMILGGLVLTLVCMATLPFGNQPLRIVRQEGDVFWIRGCSKDFLSRFK